MDKLLKTAKIWKTGEESALGIFASQEMIVDNQHRDDMIVELQTKLGQIEDFRIRLIEATKEQKRVENLLEFVKTSEICVDYGP